MKIGIDIGGSHIAIGVINENGFILEKKEKRLMSKDKKEIKKTIETYVIENTNEFRKKYKITKLGIAIPGTSRNGMVIRASNLGLKDYPIVEQLQKEIDLPIQVRNDAKCAALAEKKLGSLKNYQRVAFLTLGTGIGGAVIIQDELLDTGDFPGCEFGHMIIEKDGILCKCGKKGCFEKYGSMKTLKDNIRRQLGLDEKTRGAELLDIIRKNPENPEIQRILSNYIEYLSIGISNIIVIFEPEVIGIGGSFVYFEDILLPRLKNKIQKEYVFNKREEMPIITAVLGNDAGIIGSVI